MVKNISHSIKKQFASAGKFVVLIAVCITAGVVIVWPLWRFATSAPVPYTIAVIALLAVFAAYRIIRAVRSSPWRNTVRVLLHIAVIAGGLCAVVMLVFGGHRFAAIPVVLFIPVLYLACSHFLSRF
ncbi:MAG TPA: hypothetical protein DCL73_06740 [Treponema sp.]|nr:hypothetical protein [Treponema sp.]